ncbi:polysaccharide deacetylase family protein [Solibacillus sp. FSL K6-1126]|uniref:polysaccharide deacetylase family protein n=1 Tax=Solibacillus sp. FSL K6-1126 TaxID=2921463 RepID=UPI0030F96A4C
MNRKKWKRIAFILFLVLLFLFAAMYVFNSLGEAKGRDYYEKTGEIIWDIKTNEKVVALTFDDGPHPKYTEQILDLLEQYEAKGTFFIVGQLAEKSPELVLRMHDGGGNREQTVQALEKILPELKNQGYRFITISQMIRLQNDSNQHIVEEGK